MTTRTVVRAAGALALAATAVVLVGSPAHAAAYRYWTYWQAAPGATDWTFASQGPGTSLPADGAVEGWAFGVTTESGSRGDAPTALPDFAAVCGSTAAPAGRKRVALIVDPGPAAVAPSGETPPAAVATCVVADADASGYEVLRSVATVRIEGGLVCGVAGYPASECAPVLDDAEAADLRARASTTPAPSAAAPSTVPSPSTASGTPTDGAGGSGSPVATIAVAVLLLAGGAFWAVRRRGSR